MNEAYTVEELALGRTAIECERAVFDHIQAGDIVICVNGQGICYESVLKSIGSDNTREMLSKADRENPIPTKFLDMIGETIELLAKVAVNELKVPF